jgi:hypothetical protein
MPTAMPGLDTVDMSALGEDMLAHLYFAGDRSALVDIAFVATRSDRSDNTVAFDVRVTNRTDYQLRVPVMLVSAGSLPRFEMKGTTGDFLLRRGWL